MNRSPYTSRHPGLLAQIRARVSVGRHPQRLFDVLEADQRDEHEERVADWSIGSSALILRKSFERVVFLIPAVPSCLLMSLTDPLNQRICASHLLLIEGQFRQAPRVFD